MSASNHKVGSPIRIWQNLGNTFINQASNLKIWWDQVGETVRLKHDSLCDYIDSDIATKAELQGVTLGQIPDGAVTKEKLAQEVLDSISNKANVSAEVTALYNTTTVDATLKKAIDLSSYYAFCSNPNVNTIDCAFGKNNENMIKNLGRQLAMYAWFKGDSKTAHPFTDMTKFDSLLEICNDLASKNEILANSNVYNLIQGNAYAKSIWDASQSSNLANICTLAGTAITHTTYSSLYNDASDFDKVCKNYNASMLLTYAPSADITALFENRSALNIAYNNITAIRAFKETLNQTAWSESAYASTLKTSGAYTSSSGTWKSVYGNKCVLVGAMGDSSSYSSSGNARYVVYPELYSSVGPTDPAYGRVAIGGPKTIYPPSKYAYFCQSLQGNITSAERDMTFYYITLQ